MDRAELEQCIARLRELPARARALVADLDEEQLGTHFLEGEWSVAQNVHHLADTHMDAFLLIKLVLTTDKPTVHAYFDQDLFAETAEADGLPLESSLLLLDGLQERWAVLMESLDETQLARSFVSPSGEEIPVSGILRSYSRHGLDHLDQITKTLAAQRGA